MAMTVRDACASPTVLKQSFMNIDIDKTPSNDELYFHKPCTNTPLWLIGSEADEDEDEDDVSLRPFTTEKPIV